MTKAARRYHHGDVRGAAVAAALTRLEAEGADALTIRALAGEVGVDHRALYRHFPDRDAILTAVAAVGYSQLLLAFDAEAGEGAPLFAAFAAYVKFALARPNLHSLMLTRSRDAMDGDAGLDEAVSAVLERLMDGARAALGGAADDDTAKTLAFAGLASAYGMISLAATQTLAPREPEALQAFLIDQVRGVLEGQIARLSG